MPRVIVTTDPSLLPDNEVVLFDEHVCSVHLSTRHAAGQLVERLAWAISDAEDAEDAPGAPRALPVESRPASERRSAGGHRGGRRAAVRVRQQPQAHLA